jgi:aspartate aminotransferase-like enzyme
MLKQYLLTPGPGPVPPQVALKEALPIIHHRTDDFASIYKDISEGLKYVFQTKNEVYTLACSGTGAMEMAIVNLLSPNDEIMVASCGNFGERWVEIAQSYGIKVISVSVEWGEVVSPLQIEKTLKKNPNIKAVFTTFVETSTGVVNDIKSIGKIVANTNAAFVVDAISGIVGQEFKTDLWKVDVAISASQKGFMLPPGLAFITFSQKAEEMVKMSKLPKFYFDIKKYKKFCLKNQTPFTPPVSLIVALQEAIKLIKAKKLETFWSDCKLFSKATRKGMQALELKLFAKVPSEVVTTAVVPKDLGEKIVKILRKKYGVFIAGGQGKLKGQIIRFAHMGYISKADLLAGFACFEMALSELGTKNIEKGKVVAAVQEELSRD